MKRKSWRLSATQLAHAVANGECSATEIIEAHLQRIAEVNPIVNAVTRRMENSAREAAQEVDRRVKSGPGNAFPLREPERTPIPVDARAYARPSGGVRNVE